MGWYVIQTEPRRECKANEELNAQGYNTFYPRAVQIRRTKLRFRNKYRVEKIEIPIFPRYLFVEDPSFVRARDAIGVVDFVRCAGAPVQISAGEVDKLRIAYGGAGLIKAEKDAVALRAVAGLKVGLWFTIENHAAFSGLQARVDCLQGLQETGMLQASMLIFGRETTVFLAASNVGEIVSLAA